MRQIISGLVLAASMALLFYLSRLPDTSPASGLSLLITVTPIVSGAVAFTTFVPSTSVLAAVSGAVVLVEWLLILVTYVPQISCRYPGSPVFSLAFLSALLIVAVFGMLSGRLLKQTGVRPCVSSVIASAGVVLLFVIYAIMNIQHDLFKGPE